MPPCCNSPHAFAALMHSSSATYWPGGNVSTLSELDFPFGAVPPSPLPGQYRWTVRHVASMSCLDSNPVSESTLGERSLGCAVRLDVGGSMSVSRIQVAMCCLISTCREKGNGQRGDWINTKDEGLNSDGEQPIRNTVCSALLMMQLCSSGTDIHEDHSYLQQTELGSSHKLTPNEHDNNYGNGCLSEHKLTHHTAT